MKKKTPKLYHYPSFIALCCFAMVSCSAPQDEPGTCKLECGSAVIGGSDMQFKSVYAINSVSCPNSTYGTDGTLAVEAPVTLQYLISKESVVNKTSRSVPKGGVSFQPIVGGLMDSDATNDENIRDNNIYSGIVTPQSEWCTDACGVATLVVQPLCVKNNNNDVTVMLRSGALYSDVVSFSFKKPEVEATEGSTTTSLQ